MEITTKGMKTTRLHLRNRMTSIYFTNHQKRHHVNFFKKVFMHYLRLKNALECEFRKFYLR